MAQPPKQTGPRPKPGRRVSLRQVLDLQEAAYKAALLLRSDIEKVESEQNRARIATSIAHLSRAWTILESAKRAIRGGKKVKPVDADDFTVTYRRVAGKKPPAEPPVRRRLPVAAAADAAEPVAAEAEEPGFTLDLNQYPIPELPPSVAAAVAGR
jgi:hypothetical protein